MIDKLIIYALLAALVASGVWGLVHGEHRYAAGVETERAAWQAKVDEANRANAAADAEAAARKAAQELEWAAMAESATAAMFPPMTPDEIARASTPNVIRLDINRIKARAP